MAEIIVGAGITYFIVLYRILKEEVRLEQQGALFHYDCICGKTIFFGHTSTVKCEKCDAEYDVEIEENKVIAKLKLLPGDKLYNCIDCHKKFVVRGDDKIVGCPTCKRKYYVKGDFVKPLPKKKWW